jgi:hypothetical protein
VTSSRLPIVGVRCLVVLLSVGAALAGAVSTRADSAAAQSAPGITLSARAGFDGYYKDGYWIPVRVTVANDGPDIPDGMLSIAVPRDYGAAETLFTRSVELPTQSRREIFLYVIPDGSLSTLQVKLVDQKNKILDSANVRMIQAGTLDLLYGVLAASPSAFNDFLDLDPSSGSAFVAHLDLGDLPPVGRGWHALDALMISDVDTGALSPEQRSALAGWVAGGGRLMVAGGPAWQKTAAGLSDLLPVSVTGARTLTDLNDLGTFAASVNPVGEAVIAIGTLSPDAVTLAETGEAPLIVSRHSGFGQVTYLAFDPAFDPFKGWEGFEGLFRKILSMPIDQPSWVDGFINWSSARDAVNALPNLQLPSTFQVCGFLSIYLIVVGPLNYVVLKRLKRRELAWLTIPGIVFVFSGAAYVSGYQLQGTQATLHQLSVVQVWPNSAQAQVDELVGLFSPRRSNYDLEFMPGFLVRPIPSAGTYGVTPRDVKLEQGDVTRLFDLNTDVSSVESFVAQGQIPAPSFESELTLEVANDGSVSLNGTVANLSDLVLTDAVLLAPGPNNAQRLGEFKPGDTHTISLYLGRARAWPAQQNAVTPAVPASGVTSGLSRTTPAYYASSYDTTIDDLFGTSGGYYYNYSNREEFRRYSLLSSVLNVYGGVGRGNGIYLVGWTSTTPAPARITDRAFNTIDTTLYLITLRPEINLGEATFTVPPALMMWTPLESAQGGPPTPYDLYVYQGDEYTIRFAPAQPLPFTEVSALTLHLSSYGVTGTANAKVDLWDFAESAWSQQKNLIWGDNPIAEPDRFVGPGGEIQVRIEYAGTTQANIERLDFTLVVE